MMSFLPAGLGALGGLFGGGQEGPQLSDEQQQLWQQWMRLLKGERAASKRPIGTTALERRAAGDAQAQQTAAARQTREGLFSQMGAADMQSPAALDALKNLGQSEIAARSNISSGLMQSSLQNRADSRQRMAGYLSGAGGLAGNPAVPAQQSGLDPGLLQMFGQMWGARQFGGGGGGGNYGVGSDPWNPVQGTTVDPRLGTGGQMRF